jgi:LmbE family N-acetylglucosaminyl deacetylase
MDDHKSAAVIVAHPDDETLWAGGFILAHPAWRWTIITLCRAGDPDRSPRFFQVLRSLGAEGRMGDLDDGPEQVPLDPALVQQTILALLPAGSFDLLLTHGPRGEYTRHRRHEEACRAVIDLWRSGGLVARELWCFAYEDGGRAYLPRAEEGAALEALAEGIWQEKYRLVTQVYGFEEASYEARVTPRREAFWRFDSPLVAAAWWQERRPDP